MKSVAKNMLLWPKGKLDFSAGALVMGVLNVTPDSFSDGGEFLDTDRAVEHGIKMASDGAAVIDVGGESTRPGSESVPADQQIKRIVPVIEKLIQKMNIPISIDSKDCKVAEAALEAGASMINDITALADDKMTELVAKAKVPVVLMHMQGTPQTMQRNPVYGDVVAEVLGFLLARAKKAHDFGVDKDKIFIDPGIGFGKTLEHNLSLLKNLDKFVSSGYRVLVGPSRKNFLGAITGKENPSERVFETAAAVALCVAAGVSVVRVHDVREMVEVVKITIAVGRQSSAISESIKKAKVKRNERLKTNS